MTTPSQFTLRSSTPQSLYSETILRDSKNYPRKLSKAVTKTSVILEDFSLDVFNRLFLNSDPVINYTVQHYWAERKDKTVLTCNNEDDSLFNNIIVNS
jgi:hypothetical protein